MRNTYCYTVSDRPYQTGVASEMNASCVRTRHGRARKTRSRPCALQTLEKSRTPFTTSGYADWSVPALDDVMEHALHGTS